MLRLTSGIKLLLAGLVAFAPIQSVFAQAPVALDAQVSAPAQASSGTQAVGQAPVVNDAYQINFLFVQNADSGTFDGDRIVLNGIGSTIYFSDRPHRVAGHMQTEDFVAFWDKGEDSFKEDPPNAAVSIFGDKENTGAIVEISDPQLEGDSLSYKVRFLKGALPESFGEISLFIDSHGDAGWGAAGGLLGGLLLGKVLDSSSSQSQPSTTIIQTPPPYYYPPPPPPAYYGYAPQPYYERPPAYYQGQQAPPPQQQQERQ